jgi:hypothetical protein
MTAIIEAHGCKFSLEGDGFVRAHASDAFYRIADAIEASLREMPAVDVQGLRAGVQQDDETQEFASQAAFDRLQSIADRACHSELSTWRDGSAAFVMIGGA